MARKRAVQQERANTEYCPEQKPEEGRLHFRKAGNDILWFRWVMEDGTLVSKPDHPKDGDVYHNAEKGYNAWYRLVLESGMLVSKLCWADGTLWEYHPSPEISDELSEQDLKTVYARFRTLLGVTWIPPDAAQALHVLDNKIGIDSVQFNVDGELSQPVNLLAVHAMENGERFWGRQRTVGDAERAESDASHAFEKSRLEKKSKSPKTTITEYSINLHDRTYIYSDISEQMRHLIREHGWSLTALGELAGVDQSILSRFMSEEQAITIETLDRLARVMMIEVVSRGLYWKDYTNAIVKDRRRKNKDQG